MFFQFSGSPLELRVEKQQGGDEENHQDCHHDKERSPSRVGDWQTLAGVDSVILVASHTLLLELRPTAALAEVLVPHLPTTGIRDTVPLTENTPETTNLGATTRIEMQVGAGKDNIKFLEAVFSGDLRY